MDQLSVAKDSHQTIRQRILALDPAIDDITLADTLEGLSDLNEVIAAVVRSAVIDEALAEGLKHHIHVLQERHERLSERARARRQVARDAMVEVDLKKVTAPDFTISLRPGSPALLVANEAAIPPEYWQPREPRLDRIALLADLKNGRRVPGAELAEPQPVLSVRVK